MIGLHYIRVEAGVDGLGEGGTTLIVRLSNGGAGRWFPAGSSPAWVAYGLRALADDVERLDPARHRDGAGDGAEAGGDTDGR